MARVLENYPQIALKILDSEEKIDFGKVFGRNKPFHIEIGSGKGTFLLNEARAFPDIDFLGIEWASKFYRHAVDRLGRWEISNVRLLRTEAASFLQNNINRSSVECFHIYFPDPWPKKRHNKRRFFNDKNLALLIECLKPKGEIKFVTDHADYFDQAKQVIKNAKDTIKQIDFVSAAGSEEGEFVGTNYERKYIIEKRPIYPIALRKLN